MTAVDIYISFIWTHKHPSLTQQFLMHTTDSFVGLFKIQHYIRYTEHEFLHFLNCNLNLSIQWTATLVRWFYCTLSALKRSAAFTIKVNNAMKLSRSAPRQSPCRHLRWVYWICKYHLLALHITYSVTCVTSQSCEIMHIPGILRINRVVPSSEKWCAYMKYIAAVLRNSFCIILAIHILPLFPYDWTSEYSGLELFQYAPEHQIKTHYVQNTVYFKTSLV